MANYARVRTDALILNPVDQNTVPTNSLYVDLTSGTLTSINGVGAPSPVTESTATLFKKQMQSGHSGAIASGTPLSKRPDGRIIPTDSDLAGAQQYIGIALESFPAIGSLGLVLLIGPNAAGALTSLGFTPGQEIFVGQTTGGYISDLSSLTGDDDSIIQVGIADCGAGVASATATDLIMSPNIISRPVV
jgi:hypothetical protein